jgi:hypothetical protein
MTIFRNDVYNELLTARSILSQTVELVEHYPSVTKEDIDNGFMMRYFIRQANYRSGYITEISKSLAETLKEHPVYKIVMLEWKISGALDDILGAQKINTPVRTYTGIRTANELTATRFDKDMSGLKDRLRNYVQFWVGF